MPHAASSHSGPEKWGKSTFSNSSGNSAEIHFHDDGVDLRHSKHPNGPKLRFTPDEWVALYLGMINADPNVTPPAEWVTHFLVRHPNSPQRG